MNNLDLNVAVDEEGDQVQEDGVGREEHIHVVHPFDLNVQEDGVGHEDHHAGQDGQSLAAEDEQVHAGHHFDLDMQGEEDNYHDEPGISLAEITYWQSNVLLLVCDAYSINLDCVCTRVTYRIIAHEFNKKKLSFGRHMKDSN